MYEKSSWTIESILYPDYYNPILGNHTHYYFDKEVVYFEIILDK